ncbi:MAG: DUF3137 domain-containing protein [Lachnospiraceae bacterium]
MDDNAIVKEIRRLQKKEKRLFILWAVAGLGSVVCLFFAFVMTQVSAILFLVLLVLGIAGLVYRFKGEKIYKNAKKELKDYIGKNVVQKILAEKIEIEEYDPSNKLNENAIRTSGIVPGYDKITGSDYLRGSYKGHRLAYCDLELEREDEDSDGHKTWVTVFKGPFVRMPLGKEMKGYVKIKERKGKKKKKGILEDLFDSAVKSLGYEAKEKIVELENMAFNDQFEVKATDEEMAFYILTPQFMENILKADEYADGYTNISFKEGIAYIAINNGKDSFEIKKNMYSEKRLEQSRQDIRQDLNTILAILDEILEKDQLFS